MKRAKSLFVLGMMVFCLAAVAAADNALRIRADVPFAFYAGKELMPAGEYVFEIGSLTTSEASGSAILIQNPSGSALTRLVSIPGRAGSDSKVRLHFNQYRDQYFLSSVEGLGRLASVRKSKTERELVAMGESRLEMTLLVGD
jgi:hypothetical protein